MCVCQGFFVGRVSIPGGKDESLDCIGSSNSGLGMVAGSDA